MHSHIRVLRYGERYVLLPKLGSGMRNYARCDVRGNHVVWPACLAQNVDPWSYIWSETHHTTSPRQKHRVQLNNSLPYSNTTQVHLLLYLLSLGSLSWSIMDICQNFATRGFQVFVLLQFLSLLVTRSLSQPWPNTTGTLFPVPPHVTR